MDDRNPNALRRSLLIAGSTLALAPRLALAQAKYPSRPVDFVVPWGPGGGADQPIYRLKVVSIPTNRPLDRQYLPDRIYTTGAQKWEAAVNRVSDMHRQGRPVLVGTRSVEASEHMSGLMAKAGLPHRVLNARQDKEEADIIAEAGQEGRITVATNMAGRGTDIRLGEGVAQKGGLHVMATERHDSRRIDRQLFGRCGRQGDPGTSEALVSVDDELVSAYVGRPVRSVPAKPPSA